MRDRITLGDLLRLERVDLGALDPAPAKPSMPEQRARVLHVPPWPCTACGDTGRTTCVYSTPEHGPRWIDLCRDHALLTWPTAAGMPSTMAGILADLREVAAEAGVPLRIWTDEDGWRDEPGP